MLAELNKDDCISDNTCEGKCSHCGECCGIFIPFTDNELDLINKYVHKHNIQPQNRINAMTGDFDARCCFYDKNNKMCTIYPVRPYVCRDFICNRKTWKQRRYTYESKAKYNSTVNKMILATFDDMIYNDYSAILLTIIDYCKEPNGLVSSEKLIATIRHIGREDLLNQFTAIDENGKKIKGTDLAN